MSQVTEDLCKNIMVHWDETKQHYGITAWEERQLAYGWLQWIRVQAALAAANAKLAALERENSKLRSALEIVHFKQEPWQ